MRARTLFLFLVLSAFTVFGEENPKNEPLFTWDILWTGSYGKSIKIEDGESLSGGDLFSGGTLYNRGSFLIGLPRLDMSLRLMATDKRLMPPEEDDGKAGFNPGAGIYHDSGSRFLYGVQSEYGLSSRINNVWLRGIPFMESRSPSSRDLKADPSVKDQSESYLYLALPRNILPGFDAFSSAALDSELNPAFGGGFGWRGLGPELRLEGFYTRKELPQRGVSSWFSETPPLPERDFNIYALGALFNSSIAAFATDWAWSETYAWGEGLYGNFALRLGHKPWRFSLAGDGAGGRFADRSGSMTGDGLRFAARGERFWPRSGLLRFQGTFRSSGLWEDFDRGSLSIYFRPSAPTAAARRENPNIIRFSRSSLSLSRDARNPEKTADTLNALVGFNIGPLSTVFSCALSGLSSLDGDIPLFDFPVFETFESFKVSSELGWKPLNFRFGKIELKARMGYTVRAEKKNLMEPSLSCSFKPGKWGRIGLGITSTDFPEKWNYTLSWRFEKGS